MVVVVPEWWIHTLIWVVQILEIMTEKLNELMRAMAARDSDHRTTRWNWHCSS